MELAETNTKLGIETMGLLLGSTNEDCITIERLILPKQNGTPNEVVMLNDEVLDALQLESGQVTLGWIHTHPTQSAFLSSIDLHTHLGMQQLLPEAVAVVCAPRYDTTKWFRLTASGMRVVADCSFRGFHEHVSKTRLFDSALGIVFDARKVNVIDLRAQAGGKGSTARQQKQHAPRRQCPPVQRVDSDAAGTFSPAPTEAAEVGHAARTTPPGTEGDLAAQTSPAQAPTCSSHLQQSKTAVVPVSKLRRTAVKIERSRSHLDFISQCVCAGITPKGFVINWRCHISEVSGEIDTILRATETEILKVCERLLVDKIRTLEGEFDALSEAVTANGTAKDIEHAKLWVDRDRQAMKRRMAEVKQRKFSNLMESLARPGGVDVRVTPKGSGRKGHNFQRGGTQPKTKGAAWRKSQGRHYGTGHATNPSSSNSPRGGQGVVGRSDENSVRRQRAAGVVDHPDESPVLGSVSVRDVGDSRGRAGGAGEERGMPAVPVVTETIEHDSPEPDTIPRHPDGCARVEVINLSDRRLTESELSLLGKGLSFVPTKRQTIAQLIAELKEWERLMRLKEYWDGQDKNESGGDRDGDSQYKTSRWTPPKGRDQWLDLYIEEVTSGVIQGLRKTGRSNLSKGEDEALLSLMKDDSIIIRPADKGSSFVILNKEDYIDKLSDEMDKGDGYEPTKGDMTSVISRKVGKLVTRLEEKGYIGKNERKYLVPPRPTPGILQGNPKIHKEGAPMRTIVSGRGQATEKLAGLAESQLTEHVESQDSYVRDTGDFLSKLQEIGQPVERNGGHRPLMFCMDVAKLYPSVPRREGLDACRVALNERAEANIPTEEVLEVIELVLDNNNFQLGESRNYRQTEGTAIGSKLGRNFACTYMGAWEKDLLCRSALKPLKWYRFIDDIWGLWVHGEESLRVFHDLANQIHQNIKVDLRISDSRIEFLDVVVHLSESGRISTDLFTKPTDARAYLHYTSDHPPCVKRAIPMGLGVRLKRICSNQSDYQRHKHELVNRLVERGYPKDKVKGELRRADRMKREDLLSGKGQTRRSKEQDRVPLVVTYSSYLPNIREIMHSNRHILHRSDRLKNIFQKDPMVAYKRGRNLKDLLVHGKTRRALTTQGKQDCGRDCAICQVFYEGDTVPGVGGPVHYDKTIGCRSSNLVYGVWCNKCEKVVYVGQTGDTIYMRTQNHLSSIRCRREGRIPVNRHFSGGGHKEGDFRIIGLERTWGNSEDRRKFREMRWVGLLGTQRESEGENVRKEG